MRAEVVRLRWRLRQAEARAVRLRREAGRLSEDVELAQARLRRTVEALLAEQREVAGLQVAISLATTVDTGKPVG